jgi:hypothetical protein
MHRHVALLSAISEQLLCQNKHVSFHEIGHFVLEAMHKKARWRENIEQLSDIAWRRPNPKSPVKCNILRTAVWHVAC